MAIKKKMQDGGKAKPMTGEIGAYKKLKGKDLELEKSRYKTFGDAAGSGPSTSKTNYGPLGTGKPPKGTMKMGGKMMKKAEDGTKFGMLSVKAGVDSNPNPTAADRIAGAKMNSKAKNGAAMKKQAATAIAMKKAGVKPKAMMKKGGTMKKCKSGCY